MKIYMSCFFFYFKPMGLYSGGLIHGLIFTLVTGVDLHEDGLILGWAYPWQFTVFMSMAPACKKTIICMQENTLKVVL